MNKDQIYSASLAKIADFRFDEQVAGVFEDMIERSVPGYRSIISMIETLTEHYAQSGSTLYDLGCSLGAATIAMRQGIQNDGCRIMAVDAAPAMIERCRKIIAEDDRLFAPATAVEVVEGDIRDSEITNASMVVLNYTLQFLSMDDRCALARSIHAGLNDGGLLVLSEKVVDENAEMEQLLVDLHHEHKRRNDYSALEISRKRAALENVLIPETVNAHRERLKDAGFRHAAVWLRYFNFVSIIAIK